MTRGPPAIAIRSKPISRRRKWPPTTDDDRNALQLLRNEESNLESWWNTVLGQRQDLNGASTIDPDALKNDPMLAKIRSCSQFLNTMSVSGAFSDNSACH